MCICEVKTFVTNVFWNFTPSPPFRARDLVNKQTISFFIILLGEKIWESADLDVSVQCLLWVLDAQQTGPDLLVCGGSNKHLSVWRREEGEAGLLGGLKMLGKFGVQQGAILALAQNSTYLATASGTGY